MSETIAEKERLQFGVRIEKKIVVWCLALLPRLLLHFLIIIQYFTFQTSTEVLLTKFSLRLLYETSLLRLTLEASPIVSIFLNFTLGWRFQQQILLKAILSGKALI